MHTIDITVRIDGTPIPLSMKIAKMLWAIIEHRESIHKLSTGNVSFEYSGNNVLISLLNLHYTARLPHLERGPDGAGFVRK